jgi:hypothetical protein
MFHPVDHPMKRGWVGRLDGEHVVQLAAQTIPAFFTGGGSAREHAVYPLEGVRLLAPVLHPSSVRVFDDQRTFAFANPAAIVGPDAEIAGGGAALELLPRLAAIVGAEEALGGFTLLGEWRRPSLAAPKDRDFALALGPAVVTPDELDPDRLETIVRADGVELARGSFQGFDWSAAREHAAAGTTLRAGDLLAGTPLGSVFVEPRSAVELDVGGVGVLTQAVAP